MNRRGTIWLPLLVSFLCWTTESRAQHAEGCTNLILSSEVRSSSQTDLPLKPWRDEECGFWVYSATESDIPDGFCVKRLEDGDMFPLPDIFLFSDGWGRSPGSRSPHFPYSYSVFLLARGEVPSGTEVLFLSWILDHMMFIEEWEAPPSLNARRALGTSCGAEPQCPELYDEALFRLRKRIQSARTVDMFVRRSPIDVHFHPLLIQR